MERPGEGESLQRNPLLPTKLVVASKRDELTRNRPVDFDSISECSLQGFISGCPDAVEAVRVGGVLRVVELELAGRYFGHGPQSSPVASGQSKIRGGPYPEQGTHCVAETKLE